MDFFYGWEWRADPADEVVVDTSQAVFLAPWAVTLLCAYSLWLGDSFGCHVSIRHDPTTRVGGYLIAAGLYELLDAPRPANYLITDDSHTAPLTQITTSSEIPPFVSQVTALLQIDDEELEGAVRYSLVELLRNVVQHARSPIGGVAMAQYFPKTGLVEVAVADVGIGVRSTLCTRYPEITTELAALKFAMMPHVSGTFGTRMYGSMLDNAGLGLFFIKEIVERSAGGFFLASNNSLVDVWGNADGSPGKQIMTSRSAGWPGTFAVLQFRRNHVEDFEDLLGVCRRLAAESRQSGGEETPHFVDSIPDEVNLPVVRVGAFEEDVEAAARVRDETIIPTVAAGDIVVLDFRGIKFATQSFVHALLYKVIRDQPAWRSRVVMTGATAASREAVLAVAAYARAES